MATSVRIRGARLATTVALFPWTALPDAASAQTAHPIIPSGEYW